VLAVGKKWSVEERRAEIMRILESRRHETMTNFAFYFGVSRRTIVHDINSLTAMHPIDTVRGKGGCVKLKDGYRTQKIAFSNEEQETLIALIPLANKQQATVIKRLLIAHGSKANQERVDGLAV
jgi:predicted DNA-binding transcriptional regulator YafY